MNIISKIVLTLALTAGFYTYFSSLANFTNTAYFGGDTWEYQSTAVNFAKGHGIHTFGEYEPFETYKFAIPKDTSEGSYYQSLRKLFREHRRTDKTDRTPGYPLFLGILYTLFGVSPLIAHHVQLLLLSIVAACLPWMGMYYFKPYGFFSGLIASPIFIASTYLFSERILTECLLIFSLLLVVAAYAFFDAKPGVWRAAMLGASLGVSLFIKPVLILVPVFLFLYFLTWFFQTKERAILLYIGSILVASGAVLAPWVVYANMHSHIPVYISGQVTGNIWLQSHNEYIREDGLRQHVKIKDENSFYSNDGLEGVSPIFRVLNFYRHHPTRILKNASYKLVGGYRHFPFFLFILAFFIGEHLFVFLQKERKSDYLLSIPPFFLIVFFNFVAMTIVSNVSIAIYDGRHIKPLDMLFILTGIHAIFTTLILAFRRAKAMVYS